MPPPTVEECRRQQQLGKSCENFPNGWVDPAKISDENIQYRPVGEESKVCSVASRVRMDARIEPTGVGNSRTTFAAGQSIILAGSAESFTRTYDGYNYSCRASTLQGCRIENDFWNFPPRIRYFTSACPDQLPNQVYTTGYQEDERWFTFIVGIVIVVGSIAAVVFAGAPPSLLVNAAQAFLQLAVTSPGACTRAVAGLNAAISVGSTAAGGCDLNTGNNQPGTKTNQNPRTGDFPSNPSQNTNNPGALAAIARTAPGVLGEIEERTWNDYEITSNAITGQAVGSGCAAIAGAIMSGLAALAICLDNGNIDKVGYCFNACGRDFNPPVRAVQEGTNPCGAGSSSGVGIYNIRTNAAQQGAVPATYRAGELTCDGLAGATVSIEAYGPDGSRIQPPAIPASTTTDASGTFTVSFAAPQVDGRVRALLITPLPGAVQAAP